MVETSTPADVAELPPPPRNPLTLRQQIHAVKAFHTGQEMLRDAGGHVTRLKNGPTWLTPEAVVATSPQAARDILGGTGSAAERTPAHDEVRSLLGASLFTLKHDPWLPRRRALQPVFTKQNVRAFGGHMAQAADMVAASWSDGQQVDLDAECRRLTLRALGRSVLGHRSRRARRRDRRTLEDSPWLCHSAGDQSRQTTPLAAHSRPPASPRRGRYLAPTSRRGPAGLPRRPYSRRPSGAGDDRRDRPGYRPPTDRRRDTQRTHCVHVGRTRHHRHDPDLRAVGARPPPRHAGQGPRRNRRHR